MAPAETLEIEMSPRDSHTPPPSCSIDHCPAVDKYSALEGQMNEILALINGKGEGVGIKGTVDRHERIFQLGAKIGVVVVSGCLVSALIFMASSLAFTSTANKLRAEMHQENDSAQTKLK